jgi:hypothetical protein
MKQSRIEKVIETLLFSSVVGMLALMVVGKLLA